LRGWEIFRHPCSGAGTLSCESEHVDSWDVGVAAVKLRGRSSAIALVFCSASDRLKEILHDGAISISCTLIKTRNCFWRRQTNASWYGRMPGTIIALVFLVVDARMPATLKILGPSCTKAEHLPRGSGRNYKKECVSSIGCP
jgi:hypothetical protein